MNQVIILHASDNVATAVKDLSPGDVLQGAGGLKVLEAVPFGHKVALVAIANRAPVTKYGEPIGLAMVDIAAGGYVHIHNVESQRGRGDLPGTVSAGAAQ